MASPEKVLVHRILLRHASRPDVRLWRNETGLFWTADGGRIFCGLCKGSSDIIGISMVAIAWNDWVGVKVALEVKTHGVATTKLQHKYIAQMLEMGAIAGVVKDMDDVDALLGEP